METVSNTFAWGVVLFVVGLIALAVFIVLRILIGQLVAMAARLETTTGTVREETGGSDGARTRDLRRDRPAL